MNVLLLNASEEPIAVIPWQKAVVLLCRERAKVPFAFDDGYDIQTSQGIYRVPSAIVLNEYRFIPNRKLPCTRKNVFKRDKWSCQYCQKKVDMSSATIDHVLPSSRGGKDTWKNMVTACKPCNSKKSARTPQESGMSLQRDPHEPRSHQVIFHSMSDNDRAKWTRWLG